MFIKYDIDKDELKKTSKELLQTITNTIEILDEYINFIKFQFSKKLKYENINLKELFDEIKTDLTPFAESKGVDIYIQKTDITILSNRFWLKRAIYNICFNGIKYNKRSGSLNIKIEPSLWGIYLSISDTGIGIDRKKLKSIFNYFEQIDENSKGFGIGLALSKSVVESIGGKINVKSNENIGSEFILYLPNKPKDITIKKLVSGVVASSVLLFLGISYFPIYSQNYEISKNGGYITYKLEDGSVLKFEQNSKYSLNLNKNLYNTKYTIDTEIFKGAMTLKAIQNKAKINVENMNFQNLGTDFEISKDENIRVGVFDGKVKGDKILLKKQQGVVVTKNGLKKVKLLDKVKNLKITDNILSFEDNKKAVKYQILISKNSNFSKIENSFYTTKTNIELKLDSDTIYYIKVFGYDENLLPSMPNVVSFVNLTHYKLALQLESKNNFNEAFLELQNSVSTIKNYSSLPYYELSKLYFKNKNYSQSIKLIKKALDIKKELKYYKLLSDNYIILKQFDKLDLIIDKVLKEYPNDLELLYYKAIILKTKNQLKQAQKILFKLLQLYPTNQKANLLMSEILEALGDKKLSNYYKRLGNNGNK